MTNQKVFIGFNHGQYGDLFIGLTTASVLKSVNPECKLIYSINSKFADCKEAFLYNKDIDDIIIWDQYDNWPGPKDLQLLQDLKVIYPELYLFHPNARHKQNDWYLYRHQTAENCEMHNLPVPSEKQMHFCLEKPDSIEYGDYITICPFTSFGQRKNLTSDILYAIKTFADAHGLAIVQLGSKQDPTIEGFYKFEGTYFQSIVTMLGGLFLVSADTGMIWAASAYNHPTLGFYSYGFYPGATTAKNWIPKNINQTSFESDYVSNIDISLLPNTLMSTYKLARSYRS